MEDIKTITITRAELLNASAKVIGGNRIKDMFSEAPHFYVGFTLLSAAIAHEIFGEAKPECSEEKTITDNEFIKTSAKVASREFTELIEIAPHMLLAFGVFSSVLCTELFCKEDKGEREVTE